MTIFLLGCGIIFLLLGLSILIAEAFQKIRIRPAERVLTWSVTAVAAALVGVLFAIATSPTPEPPVQKRQICTLEMVAPNLALLDCVETAFVAPVPFEPKEGKQS